MKCYSSNAHAHPRHISVLLFHNKCECECVCVCLTKDVYMLINSTVEIVCACNIDVHAFSFKLWTTWSDSNTVQKNIGVRFFIIPYKSAREERNTNKKNRIHRVIERDGIGLTIKYYLRSFKRAAKRGMQVILVNRREKQTHIRETFFNDTYCAAMNERSGNDSEVRCTVKKERLK